MKSFRHIHTTEECFRLRVEISRNDRTFIPVNERWRKWKYCDICRKWLKHSKRSGKYITGGRIYK